MQLGIFAKTFPRARFGDTLDAVAAHGFRSIQFNFSCVGLPTLPAVVEPGVLDEVQRDCQARGILIAGVSGTFNLIHPDVESRRVHMERLGELARATRVLGCDLITLCSGTRDAEDMWRAHSQNSSPLAWRDLLHSLEQAIQTGEKHDVLLGIEPEVGNVVNSTRKARQLLDELHCPRVKIVADPANLFPPGPVEHMRDTLEELFQLLGTDIVMAHAKELAADGSTGGVPPGRGVLDWNYYFDTLARMNFAGPIVMHGLNEADVPQSARFLRSRLFD
jgi:sugar phosphate isomerase/epimerase